MPKGLKRAIVAAFVGLALGYPAGHGSFAQTSGAKNESEATQGEQTRELTMIGKSIDRLTSAVEAMRTGPEAEVDERRAERALNVQDDMARWTFWMFIAAALSTVITGAGLGLLYGTLRHTKRAADFAGQVANETTVAVQAAVEANREMREANEIAREGRAESALANQEQRAQRRPYLSIDDVAASIRVNPDPTTGGYWVEAELSFAVGNSGQSIARNVRIWAEISPMNLGAKTADWQLENINHVFPTHIAPASVYRHVGGAGCPVAKEKVRNPIYFSLCVAYESDVAAGPLQTCEEYIGYKEMFGSEAVAFDLSVVSSATAPVPLLMRRSRMFSRMT